MLDLQSQGARAWAAAKDWGKGVQLVLSANCMPGTEHALSHLIPMTAWWTDIAISILQMYELGLRSFVFSLRLLHGQKWLFWC